MIRNQSRRTYTLRGCRFRTVIALATVLAAAGCETASRTVKLPPGCLPVRYESATAHTSCLVASVAMAANYLLDEHKFSEGGIRQEMIAAGLDETRIGDMDKYLSSKGLHLVTLRGRLEGKPPVSLRYWLFQRGYPVICIINRKENEPGYNHAVVVVGISQTSPPPAADMVHYLDPASPRQLHSDEVPVFETLWARGENAMLIVVAPPETPPADRP